MATFKDIERFFNNLESDFARRAVPRIIAEKATEYYKQKFTTKEWDGKPWDNVKYPIKRGSLLVRSGKLMASIKPKVVRSDRVVISAGSGKVPYAQIHNEGGDIVVTDKMKRFFWAQEKQARGSQTYSVKSKGLANTSKNKRLSAQAEFFKGMALKKMGSKIHIPRRQFMGHSAKLNDIFMDSFTKAFKDLF